MTNDEGDYKLAVEAYERQDYATAVSIWLRLAEKGYAEAQFNLGLVYHYGQGVEQDYPEALKWFRLAAEQGNVHAQNNLAAMYYYPRLGITQDYAEAAKWYRSGAEQGDPKSQGHLGLLYTLGHGVTQDNVQAYKWFCLAAARATKAEIRDSAIRSRDLIAEALSPNELAEAQKLAREWRSN